MPAFDPDKYLAERSPQTGGFDPDAYLSSKSGQGSKVSPQISPVESAIRGAAQGATLGFADELTGGAEAAGDVLSGKAKIQDLIDKYRQHRDESRANYTAAQQANPNTYLGGELGGGIATAFVPGLGGASVGKAAALGAAAGLGGSTGDITKGEVLEPALKTGGGALLGGAIGKAADVAFNPGEYAETLALRHLRPTPKVARMLGPEKLSGAAREALDTGSIKFGGTAADTAENIGENLQNIGALKGDIVQNAVGKVDPAAIAQKFDNQVIEPLRKTAENDPLVSQLVKKKEDFVKFYENKIMTPADLEAEKMAAQGNINYLTDAKTKQQAVRDWANVLKEGSEDAINDPNFARVKQAYGNLKNAQLMSERTASLTDGGGGLMGHLTDLAVGHQGLGLAAGGNPVGIGAIGARMLTKGRVSSSGAVALDTLNKVLQSSPDSLKQFLPIIQEAASRGQNALAATHYLLSKNPEYNETLKGGDTQQPMSLQNAQEKYSNAP